MTLYINFFIILILITSLLVILAKNPVQSVLFLVLVFFFSSLLLLLLGAEFLSILLIIIYVGAISILFLFVVMMLNLKVVELHSTFYNYLPIGTLIGLFFVFEFLFFIYSNLESIDFFYVDKFFSYISYDEILYPSSNLVLIGEVLYNYNFAIFLMASMVLLVSMIGSILLTVDLNLRKRKEHSFVSFRITRQSLGYWRNKIQ